jgi:hypothetical protein
MICVCGVERAARVYRRGACASSLYKTSEATIISTGKGLGGVEGVGEAGGEEEGEEERGGALLGVVKKETSSPHVRGVVERRPWSAGLRAVLASILIRRMGNTEGKYM